MQIIKKLYEDLEKEEIDLQRRDAHANGVLRKINEDRQKHAEKLAEVRELERRLSPPAGVVGDFKSAMDGALKSLSGLRAAYAPGPLQTESINPKYPY